jgi:hypothetical protein
MSAAKYAGIFMTVSFFQANLIFEGDDRVKTPQGATLREGSGFYHKITSNSKNSYYKQSS